jgi:hypothetical protein
MNESQAEKFFKTACVPEPVQSVMQDSVGKSREFYSKAATATQDGAKVLTELADTAWSNTEMLNAKIIQNATANAEAAFDAAGGLFPCLNSSCLSALCCGHGHQIGCRVWPLSQHPARPSYFSAQNEGTWGARQWRLKQQKPTRCGGWVLRAILIARATGKLSFAELGRC